MKNRPGAFKKPAQRVECADFSRERRNSQKQNRDVAEENNHGGKQISLRGDVALARLQGVKRERDVKGISRAEQ